MSPTGRDLLALARRTQKEVRVEQVVEALASDQPPLLVDVRESDEYREGAIPGALWVPRGFLELRIEAAVPDRAAALVLYCAAGSRSLLAAETLSHMGYTSVRSLEGGFAGWQRRRFLTEKPVLLSAADRRRYARHLSIPEVGEVGQLKLLETRVLLIGAGGLGSPVAYYLAAAGMGTIGIVDFDTVDESNLQRQILHTPARVGTSKVSSAVKTLEEFNPGVKVLPFEERLHSENVESIFRNFDIVVDGSDNFPTRYLVNDACVHLQKPCVHGSVHRFEGQVTVFDAARGGPCYRCLYPEPPPADEAASCAEAGVLGVLPGVIGLLQAVETVKLALALGESLRGRLLTYEALAGGFREFKLKPDPQCAYCAPGKAFPGYSAYEKSCAASPGQAGL